MFRRVGYRALAALAVAVLLAPAAAEAEYKIIDKNQSKLDIEITGFDNSKLKFYYGGWNDDYSIEKYAAYYNNRYGGEFIQIIISILANNEYYWESGGEITVDTIKKLRRFKNKDISIVAISKGFNSYMDSSVGEPGYLLFRSGTQNCAYVRRFSDFDRHGGSAIPYVVGGIYCAPLGDPLTKAQAAEIAKNGMIYIEKPTGAALN